MNVSSGAQRLFVKASNTGEKLGRTSINLQQLGC
jgi:hypothetical protein